MGAGRPPQLAETQRASRPHRADVDHAIAPSDDDHTIGCGSLTKDNGGDPRFLEKARARAPLRTLPATRIADSLG